VGTDVDGPGGDPCMKAIHAPDAVAPHGHYVQAIEHAGTIYVSGLLGNASEADDGRDIEAQAQHSLDQLTAILAAAESSLDRVLKLGVFVTDVSEWPRVNAVCAARFGDHRPARIVVPCGPMRFGSRIEIDAIAASN
jgi:2-iminobutanoate/2-iminopropanoate deaminase